jgi:hypothetical protein
MTVWNAKIENRRPDVAAVSSVCILSDIETRGMKVPSREKVQDSAPGKPTLRRRTEQKQKGQTQETADGTDDDRPTLKRRPDSPQ